MGAGRPDLAERGRTRERACERIMGAGRPDLAERGRTRERACERIMGAGRPDLAERGRTRERACERIMGAGRPDLAERGRTMSGRVRGPGRARSAETGVGPFWRLADLAILAAIVVGGSVLLVPAYGSSAPVWATALGAAISVVMLTLTERLRWSGIVAALGITAGVVVLGAWLVAPQDRI